MEKYPITGHSLEMYYGVDGNLFERQYKHYLSDYENWDQKDHADQWLLFPKNMGTHLSLDETALSNGDLRTILSNKSAHGKRKVLLPL